MGKIAYVFAGQGAQSVGMGKDLYEYSDQVRKLFDMAESKRKGILSIMFDGPKEQLDITINTQPCLFLTDLACAIVLGEKGVAAHGVAGFSLGEVPAACYAGLMDQSQAFDVVDIRARAMHTCCEKTKGTMFAVMKLSHAEVEEVCAEVEYAYPVNYNCPGQMAAACAVSSAEAFQQAVAARGGKAIRLSVSGAFHSPMMDEAGHALSEYLKTVTFGDMRIPLYANLNAKVYGNPAKTLSEQVHNPVLWQKTIENMIADGFDTFIEVGPGKTLTGFTKKINADVRVFNVSDISSLETTIAEVL